MVQPRQHSSRRLYPSERYRYQLNFNSSHQDGENSGRRRARSHDP